MENKSIKLLFYCTKGEPYLRNYPFDLSNSIFELVDDDSFRALNGYVVAEAECDLVEKMGLDTNKGLVFDRMFNKETQLTLQEMTNYVGDNYYYAIHIENVKPFDEPKELSDYFKPQNSCRNSFGWLVDDKYPIQRASQNMMYCYDRKGILYILISIKPERLCKILNREKTIEIRKSILKVLKELIR